MKILFVCQQYIHAARWIGQLKDTEHEIYVFDCLDRPLHKDLLWTNYTTGWRKRKVPYFKGEYFLEKKMSSIYEKIVPYLEVTASEKLEELIKELKPDLVHSLEMQSQTYPLLKVRKRISFNWAYSCWGNDIYFYKDKKEHKLKIEKIIHSINYFFLECNRDKDLIKSIDSNANVLAVDFPGGGGYYIEKYQEYVIPVEKRNLIILKGYEHNFGRALFILNALVLIAEELKDYEIYVYSAHDIVEEEILKINKKHNLKIKYSTRKTQISHQQLLEKFGSAKIAIGNSVSDGIPNTLLEAIILGAFPIQSNPGGASEDYISDGENGFLIQNPEDAVEISKLISKALKNDALLENAFVINKEIAKKLAYKTIQQKVLNVYNKMESEL
ncbi:glycosyltransferase [Polaribacter sp. Hel1_85]|uniref:glycosyltransferase n=1 Tax=Polaribacter sp. Hel1_85 TaxID=1250005 RepID=UPI00052C2B22|nr:glycosyltransferase [Polaribacter sp. Hel1_85]KGL63235.1 glycosyltransferase, GT4 family [Polaribacter sp. Hel1_85]